MRKKAGSGSGMKNPDQISESSETIFWVKILKFFDADPDPDPQHWFLTFPEIDLEQVGTGLWSSLYSLLIFLVNFLAPESGSAFQIQTWIRIQEIQTNAYPESKF
jgi:hypothetical protein